LYPNARTLKGYTYIAVWGTLVMKKNRWYILE